MEKKQRNRFSFQDDLYLLQEVVGHNPFEEFSRWRIICINVRLTSGKNFTIRAVREHVEHLLQLYIKNGRASLRKSLSEEQYKEKDRLLQEVKKLWIEYKKRRQIRAKEINIEKQKIIEVAAVDHNSSNSYITETDTKPVLPDHSGIPSTDPLIEEEEKDLTLNNDVVSQSISPSFDYQQSPATSNAESITQASSLGQIRVRNSLDLLENSSVQFLQEKQEWDRSIRERELQMQEKKLQLEERKLKLEEEKFQLEKEERTRRLQIEIKERENNMTMLQQQQNIISYFLNGFNKQ